MEKKSFRKLIIGLDYPIDKIKIKVKKMEERYDWEVKVYDKNNNILDAWDIDDRTENEAEKEAEAEVQKVIGFDDWTLTQYPRK